MQRDPGSSKVDEIFRDALADDEPVEEGDVGVGQTRRLGADAGAAQSVYAGAPQASGVAPEREGRAPLPPDRGRPGEASDDETEQLRIRQARGELGESDPDEGQPHERMRK
jgi:hypothetical protein